MDAVSWLEHSLRMGSSLSSLLFERIDRISGWTFLGDTTDGPPADFHENGRGGSKAARSIGMGEYLVDQRAEDPRRMVLVENLLLRRRDPHVTERALYVDENVLLWEPLASGNERIQEVLNRAESGWAMNAFISSTELGPTLFRTSEMTGAPLQRLAVSVQSIIVSVFDGEGYLVYQLENP